MDGIGATRQHQLCCRPRSPTPLPPWPATPLHRQTPHPQRSRSARAAHPARLRHQLVQPLPRGRTAARGCAARHPQVHHIRVEDGPGRRLGRSFAVRLWPTLIFLREGQEVARLVRPAAPPRSKPHSPRSRVRREWGRFQRARWCRPQPPGGVRAGPIARRNALVSRRLERWAAWLSTTDPDRQRRAGAVGRGQAAGLAGSDPIDDFSLHAVHTWFAEQFGKAPA